MVNNYVHVCCIYLIKATNRLFSFKKTKSSFQKQKAIDKTIHPLFSLAMYLRSTHFKQKGIAMSCILFLTKLNSIHKMSLCDLANGTSMKVVGYCKVFFVYQCR